MKTTVDLPDDLLITAKKVAAERRMTLKALITRGLRQVLETEEAKTAPRREIRWLTVDGGLPPGVDVSDREAMHDWIAGSR